MGWQGFWIGLGLFAGMFFLGVGLADLGSAIRTGLVQSAALMARQAKYEESEDEK